MFDAMFILYKISNGYAIVLFGTYLAEEKIKQRETPYVPCKGARTMTTEAKNSSETAQESQRSRNLQWLASLAISAGAYAAAVAGGLSGPSAWFLAVTLLAVCLWGFALLNDGLVAVMLPIGYILCGVGQPKQILAPWTQPMGWLILGGLMTGLVLMHTGLARRIALWALHVTRGSFVRVLWGILLAGFIIAPLMPTAIGKSIIISIICIGICDSLGFAARSREASTVLMAGCLAVLGPRMGYYTGAGEVTLNMEMLATAGFKVTWFDFLLYNYVPSIIYSVVGMLVLLAVMRPKAAVNTHDYVEKQYATLGPMSFREKKATLLFVVLTLLMMTDKYHGINIAWIMMSVGFAGFLPIIDLVDSKKFETLNLTAVLFVVGCMSIGAGAQATGMDKTIAVAMLPMLQSGGELMTVISSFWGGVVVNFLLTPVAAVSTFTVPIAEMCREMGISPLAPAFAFQYGLDQFVLPYEYSVFLFFFSTGYINFKHLVQVFGVRIFVTFLLLVTVFYPFWKLTGAV